MSERPKIVIRPPSTSQSRQAAAAAFMAESARPEAENGPADRKLHPRKRKGGAMDRISGYVPVELGAEARAAAAAKHLELSQVLAEALRLWLAKQKRGAK